MVYIKVEISFQECCIKFDANSLPFPDGSIHTKLELKFQSIGKTLCGIK